MRHHPDNGNGTGTDTGTGPERPTDPRTGPSRRRLLGTVGAAGTAGLALGAAGGALGTAAATEPPTALSTVGSGRVPFRGDHQPGITEPAQAHGHLLALDLAPGAGRKEAAALLRRWTRTAEALMAGEEPAARLHDTGIALDAGPSSLTVTFGFGRSFFDRTGLAARRPSALAPLPPFSADELDAKRSDGDLWVQIGADDALVAFHALRALQREADGTARVRWQMNGFNRSPGATASPRTARNLMGQIDGTNNPKETDEDFGQRVFVPAGGDPEWMAGGSYAVVRRIRMLLDDWERVPLDGQEKVVGRRKSDGAPLSGGSETTAVDLEKRGPDGGLAIAADAHVRVTAPASNGGAAMLRRSFSYHDGFRDDGSPDAGLLFVAWQADPVRGFVPVQRKLDRGDALSRFIRHEASALFAVPGGAREGEYVGQRLFEG
ncbi:deferrochelatase/peroxidase EfeB [Streptomyces verrucosisporus]|uniref:iron uptake transporter deferrochelatase/peroxidase subunit n=1 Tax=Streptomyces verrucosisporus TaxID=1695161 RepID=UPI0019D1B506|nr:iron uptake transporter deferrochelatase/peroxidase subunit [Streptomyces verrucosisporus]MBN3929364.1 deferrochelatase/peroxidase EfeB [Streptomyces verrucosisporus]